MLSGSERKTTPDQDLEQMINANLHLMATKVSFKERQAFYMHSTGHKAALDPTLSLDSFSNPSPPSVTGFSFLKPKTKPIDAKEEKSITSEINTRFKNELLKKFKQAEVTEIFMLKFKGRIPSAEQLIQYRKANADKSKIVLDIILNDPEFMKESIKKAKDLSAICHEFSEKEILSIVFNNTNLFKTYCCDDLLDFCKTFPDLQTQVINKIASKSEYFIAAFESNWVFCNFVSESNTALNEKLKVVLLESVLSNTNYFKHLLNLDRKMTFYNLMQLCDSIPAYKTRFIEKAIDDDEIRESLREQSDECNETVKLKVEAANIGWSVVDTNPDNEDPSPEIDENNDEEWDKVSDDDLDESQSTTATKNSPRPRG